MPTVVPELRTTRIARTLAFPPPPPLPCCTTPVQDYNDGSAPFPYATECTAAAATATCDPAALVAEMDFPGSADPVTLDVTSATANGALEPVSVERELSVVDIRSFAFAFGLILSCLVLVSSKSRLVLSCVSPVL